ncbi:MAG: SDR family oxidoreductase [Caulobacterales bacterium]
MAEGAKGAASLRSVRGRVALITGAAHGMGRATAMLFAADGAHVAVTDRDGGAAAETAAAIKAQGGSAQAWTLDVTDAAGISRVTQDVAETFGGLDILINNAGVSARLAIDHPDYESNWIRVLDILLTAQQRLVRAALPYLRQSDAARIVNIASTEALGGTAYNTAYAAAKAGVVGLTRTLAVELGREAITVNCICPGPILTELTKKISEEDRAKFARRRTALGRYGVAEEVAHMTLSLCLPAASYVTGVILPVDGGLTARNA